MLFVLVLPVWGDEEPTMNDGINKIVYVTEPGDRLGDMLKKLSDKTGIRLYAHTPMREVPVVVRYKGSLQGLMDALAHFFAVNKTHRAKWLDEGGDRYTLARSHEGERAAQNLVKERQQTLDRAMDQAVRDGNRWVKHLCMLSDAERLCVYAGMQIAHPANHFGGRHFLDNVLLQDAPNWSDNSIVTYGMEGRSPFMRMLTRSISDLDRGDVATEGFAVAQICPALAPERQQAEWRLQFGDPAPRGGPVVNARGEVLRAPPLPQGDVPITRRALLIRIAECADTNLIADDAGQALNLSRQPATGTVAELLDAACAFQWGSGQESDTNHGSFWRKVGDTYLVRSIAWPEEELGDRS